MGSDSRLKGEGGLEAEEKLKEFYGIINRSPVVVFLWKNDEGWPVEYVSENVGELFGYSAEEFVSGKVSYAKTVHPDDLERVGHEVEKYSQDQRREEFTQEYRIVTKDGKVKWTDDRTWIRRDKKGEITHYQGIILDITERKEAEEVLRDSEEHHRNIVQTSLDGFWINDMDGRIIDVNGAYCQMLGYSREELLKMSISDAEAVEKPEDTARHIKQIIEDGHDRFETRQRRKDGKIIDVEVSATYSNESGGRLIVFLRDITEHKQSEEKLRRLSSVVEQSSEGMAVADLEGNLLFVNPAWADMHGYESGKELLGKQLKIFHNQEQLERDVTPFNEKVKEKGSHTDEVGHIRKDGTPFPTMMTTTLLKDEQGKPYAIAGIAKDITNRKIAEETLIEKEQKYRTLFESSRDAIMMLAPPTWKFTAANKATIDMFKAKDEAEFTSLGPWNVSPETQPDGKPSSVKAPEMIMKAMKEGSNFFEWIHKTLNNEDFPVTVLLTRIEIEGKQLLQATVRDITEQKRAEEAIRASEEQLHTVLESVRDGIIFSDASGHFYVFNSEMENLTGYSKEEANACGDFNALIHPNPEEHWQASETIKNILETGEDQKSETTIQTKSGETRNVIVSTTLVPYKGRKMFLSAYRDITDRKKAEEELSWFSTAFKGLNEIVFITDLEGKIDYVNQHSERRLGYTRNTLYEESYRKITSQDQWVKASSVLNTATGTISQETEYTTKQGLKFPVWENISIIRDTAGKPQSLAFVSRDLSERKSMEYKLQESEERYRSLIENTQDIIYAMDTGGVVTYISHQVERMGYSQDEVITRPFAEFLYKDDKKKFVQGVKECVKTGKGFPTSFRMVDKEGEPHWFEETGRFQRDEKGGIIGTIGILRDVTDRKRAEEELNKRLSELERFQKVTVDRELKMIELKKKIKELEKQLGKTGGPEIR
ncbi:MAG: PAS domain S-box protein [Candidatus Altiarchaeota archaeon]